MPVHKQNSLGRILALFAILTIVSPVVNALDFTEAVSRAMAEAPVLEASEAGVESSQRLVEQAGRMSNPSFSIEAENFAGSRSFDGTDAAEYTVVLEQPLELGGKRKARRILAEADLDESLLLAKIAREELVAKVRRRFIDCLYAYDRLRQAMNLEDAARSAAEAVDVQKGIGAAAGLDERATRISLNMAQIEKDRASRDYDEARELLASLWDGPANFEVEGELRVPESLPGDIVFEDLMKNSARWQLASLPAERQKRVLQLERSSAWPEVALGVGHRWIEEEDAQAWVAGLSFSIPIFDRNLGGIEAAASGVRRSRAEVEMQRRELRDSIRQTVSSLRRAHQTAIRLQDEVLPLARETAELVAEGYGLGRYELLYVLEAQKTLSEVEGQLIDVLAEFHLAVSDLQSLIGQLPPSLEF